MLFTLVLIIKDFLSALETLDLVVEFVIQFIGLAYQGKKGYCVKIHYRVYIVA